MESSLDNNTVRTLDEGLYNLEIRMHNSAGF